MTHRHALRWISIALLATGCSSEPRTIEAGSSRPASAAGDATTGRRVVTPARGSSSRGAAAEPARPARPRSAVALAFTDAVRDFTGKVAAQAARRWPAHLPLSSLPPPRPVVRVDRIVNETREHVDTSALADELVQRLIEQNQVEVAASQGDDLEALMDERAYADAMGEAGEPSSGGESAVGLVVRGAISDDVVEVDGERTTTTTVVLRLIDVKRAAVVLQTRTVTRAVR